ncbi:RING-type E3 ubiquitin transferase [Malassezia yamatoensis]|uniref:RING-type E3 ubiquitin transferase n=1 Tax=Malassezia yamatoensis TaxID=253288 RepID=A0AAJ5YST0_9BASI|nr:RING-type E3 ubiquitin transferase [Malassezia yamatoensis]
MSERWIEWDSATAGKVFEVQLEPGGEGVVLNELADELREDGSVLRLSLAMGDRILISRLSMPISNETSFDYCVRCWNRCRKEEARVRQILPEHTEEAIKALNTIKELLISYAGLVIQMPDMFPNGTTVSAQALIPTLLQLSSADGMQDESLTEWATPSIPDTAQFLKEFVARFAQDDALEETVGAALLGMTQRVRDGYTRDAITNSSSAPAEPSQNNVQNVLAQMLGVSEPRTSRDNHVEDSGMTLAGLEWRPIQQAVANAMEYKPLAQAVPSFACFMPNVPAPMLETHSLLGPFFRLSCFADVFPAIAKKSFSDYKSRSVTELENSTNSLRMAIDVVQANNFRIVNSMVRAGTDARDRVLGFFGLVCSLNAKRGAMQASSREISTDSFMVNVYDVVLRFAMPFAELSCSKIDRIDVKYLRHQTRWDTKSLTRINASEAEAVEWLDTVRDDNPPNFNFITEIFFLGTRMSNLALGKAMRRVEEREKEINRLQKRIDEFELDRCNWQHLPQAAHIEQVVNRARSQSDKLHSEIIAAQTALLSPSLVQRVLQFTNFTIQWLARLADQHHSHPQPVLTLPLADEANEDFRMLPEHMFEDVCDTILFYARRKPEVLDEATRNSVVLFCTIFLTSGSWVRNPFLKAKMAEMLAYNVMSHSPQNKGALLDPVNTHPLALQHLVPALMAFWIDAESTGSHTQFYDKFNIRYHLVQIFKTIWPNPEHKKRLYQQADAHLPEFTVFINRLMNDVTFLLDDALDKLSELHNKQLQMEDSSTWESFSFDERREHETHMRSIESQIRSDLGLGHEFLRLLINFTEETSDAFMTPEIVDRLAAMLDYNLEMMVGQRCQELRVRDPKKIGFEPRTLLKEILSVFLNLSDQERFAKAIARDGRSYRPELFSRAASIAQRHMLKSPSDIDRLAMLVDRVEKLKQVDTEEEEDLGEVPDQYLDPLLATLMRDPVRLPSSRAVVDRSTIKAHLLSDSKDPFNRMPLKLADVETDHELRAEIQAFLQERRSAAAAAAAGATSTS